MVDAGKTKGELITEGWDRWRRADFTWAGLATKEWQGWVVSDDGFVREAERGAVYGAALETQMRQPDHDVRFWR